MTGGSLGLRTGSYGSLQLLHNGGTLHSQAAKSSTISRKPASKMVVSGAREKERFLSLLCRYLGRKRVSMLLLFVLALLVFSLGSFIVNKESTSPNAYQRMGNMVPSSSEAPNIPTFITFPKVEGNQKDEETSVKNGVRGSDDNAVQRPPLSHPCKDFAFPPPPPMGSRRIGPRPCPVCYLPVEQAIASMPRSTSESPVLRSLSYVHDESPMKTEPHGGSDFGGYPSLKQRNDSFDIKESMTVHCGFVKGAKPGLQTGFDIDEADLIELEQHHEVIVASAIFGNYDIIQQPKNISEEARNHVPFYMFIDEETESYMRNSSVLDDKKRIGLWRIIVVHNIPYNDARRNGKVPKLLLHRIFPNVRYSIWIDGKLELVVDPYQLLERFLWRQNANFAISRHYRRFDVFEEAEANKAAGKYDNASIDYQIEFYKEEGLTPYSEAKLPITSDVPEGCVIIREHIPITNLFTCLWFNEVDRFTSRDQLSFSTVRDKITAKVDWSVYMFMDCERRNFVNQAYHRELLEHMAPPIHPISRHPPTTRSDNVAGKISGKRSPAKRGRDKRPGSRRHRKAAAGNRDINSI